MYKKIIKNLKSGPFGNTMVVSMRIFKKSHVDNVINICKPFHWAHGKPVILGIPTKLAF